MSVEIRTVRNKRDLEAFVRLPWKIYRNDPAWVPPLLAERRAHLDRRRNPFFEYGEAEFFLAMENGEAVGRISAHTNPRHNEIHDDNVGFFGFFESTDDHEVAQALFAAAEDWLKKKGKEA